MIADAGTGRKNSTSGCKNSITPRDDPISAPSPMPRIDAASFGNRMANMERFYFSSSFF
jgi:hypothetical protein